MRSLLRPNILAAEAGWQHGLILNTMLGSEEADLLAAAHDGQVDELGLGLAFDARSGTHFVACFELVGSDLS